MLMYTVVQTLENEHVQASSWRSISEHESCLTGQEACCDVKIPHKLSMFCVDLVLLGEMLSGEVVGKGNGWLTLW